MKLFSLLKNINARVLGNVVIDINGLYHKDTEVKDGGIFFCLRGTRVDGNDYVKSAIKNGAVAIVTEQEIQNLAGVTQVIVKNAREVMSEVACKFYGNPASRLKIIGITGTNGKTTTSNMIASCLETAGKRVSVVGTNGVFIRGTKFDSGMTTPDPIELQKYFQIMARSKVEYVVMEVSAHAIELSKISGFLFEAVIFTNLTEDHLDYFKTMERYFEAKAKLFSKKHAKLAVLNADDPYAKRLAESINLPYVTYSNKNSNANFFASNITLVGAGQKFKLNNVFDFSLQFAGNFNVSNALAAIATLEQLGFSETCMIEGLKNMKPVDGRFNSVMVGEVMVVVDYAHTPDGLENILSACREISAGKKVISVFGCGGNRDSAKRPIMGKISTTLADFTIITSDNPRFEKREDIAKDIERGITNKNYMVILDRSAAIREAVKMAHDGDIVVVAGKGAEPYIDENGEKMPYSDLAEIEKIRRTKK